VETIFVISSRNKWGVHKRHGKRAIRVFKHRDLAFHFATKYKATIVVMTKDGSVDFTYINSDVSKIKITGEIAKQYLSQKK